MFVGVYQRMKKVLIIGGGYGALRYVESLIWTEEFGITMCGMEVSGKTRKLAERFWLPYISIGSLNKTIINSFDCVIVAVVPEGKYRTLEFIVKKLEYNHGLIIEKPLSLESAELREMEQLLHNIEKCAIVCQRDFLTEEYRIPEFEEYRIKFPSYQSDAKSNIIHMLPHVISWLISNGDDLEYLIPLDTQRFEGIWRKKKITIEIVRRTEDDCTMVNEVKYPNIQYRKVNAMIVKKVLAFEKRQSETSLQNAIKTSKIIIKILEDLKL